MAYGDVVHHLFGPGAGQPALYAVVAMGAVFASAARAPLTSLASVVEMTGDFALTLPVMLAVAIASMISRALSYGTIYTTKLLRRGTDIDRATPWRALADLKIADAMRPFRAPLPVPPAAAPSIAQAAADGGSAAQQVTGRSRAARAGHLPGRPAGPVRHRVARPGPAAAGGLRPRRPAGPVTRRPPDTRLGHRTRRAGRHRPPDHQRAGRDRPGPAAADWDHADPDALPQHPPTPLPGYQVTEITIPPGSPATGHRLGDLTWPPGSTPVTVLRGHQLRPPQPDLIIAPGDRISLLTAAPGGSPERHPADESHAQPASDGSSNLA